MIPHRNPEILKETEEMPDQKNLIVAIGLSLLVLVGYHYFIERPRLEKMREIQTQEAARTVAPAVQAAAPAAAPETREDVLDETVRRIAIKTPSLTGSLNLKGARFDDLQLAEYFTTLEKTENVILLSPVGTESPYYIEQGWLADNVRTPSADAVWQSSDKELTPEKPITLRWNNGEGITFVKTISVDSDFMFTVTQKVENHSGREITVYPYARIMRLHHEDVKNSHTVDSSMGLVTQGLLGVLNGSYESAKYDELTKAEGKEETKTFQSTGGWLGVTDKYWVTALIPNQEGQITARYVRTGEKIMGGTWPFRHTADDNRDFQADYRAPGIKIAAGASAEETSHFFAGAKEMRVLDAYEKQHHIPRFDLVVDFGWFYILTKPFFYLLTWLGQHVGNFGVAILVFTLLIRIVMYPVAAQSYRSMQKMKDAAPKMKELQAKYKDDPAKLQGEMMAFYKREKVNPMAGCLPMLIQIPIFFSLYKVLYVTLEMRHAHFFGPWQDLSSPDPTNLFNLFGLLPYTPPAFLHMGLLPLLMGLTTWLQMKMSPAPTDPTQKQVMALMPWMMMIMMAGFPAGLLIYWTFSNVFAIAQQWWIKRQLHPN